jgi:hypothetical protein
MYICIDIYICTYMCVCVCIIIIIIIIIIITIIIIYIYVHITIYTIQSTQYIKYYINSYIILYSLHNIHTIILYILEGVNALLTLKRALSLSLPPSLTYSDVC